MKTIIFFYFLIVSFSAWSLDYIGGAVSSGKETVAIRCLIKNQDNPKLCDMGQYILIKGKIKDFADLSNLEVLDLGNPTLTQNDLAYTLKELEQFDEEDFTNNKFMKYFDESYVSLSLFLVMVGQQIESKAVIGVAGASLILTAPIDVIKSPFSHLARYIQKKKQESRKKEFTKLIKELSLMKLIGANEVNPIKVSKETLQNVIELIAKDKRTSKKVVAIDLQKESLPLDEPSTSIQLIQKFKTNSKVISSPVATKDGTVIVGSHLGVVYIFSPEMRLISKFSSKDWIHGSPKVSKNNLMTIPSYDGSLYYFDLEGKMVKSVAPGGSIFSSTAELPDGTTLIGSDDGNLYFISEVGKVLRSFKTEGMIHCTPTVMKNGNIAVSSIDHKLYIIDQEANLKYTYETGAGLVHSQPIELKDGTLVFGSYDKGIHFISPEGKRKALFMTGGWVHSSPAILNKGTDKEVIVVGSNDGYIYYLNSDGTLKTKFKTGAKVISSPVVMGDGNIAVGSYDSFVYFLDGEGKLVGKFKTGLKIWSSPTLMPDGKTIVIGSGDHYLYYLQLKN
ncbi:MAG: PQQ-binding-like beta-propeller repeat protein [Bacteriovoracaceae bacterium]